MLRLLPYFLPYLLLLSVYDGYRLGGWWTFQTPVWVFVIIPLIDLAVGLDKNNPDESKLRQLAARPEWRSPTWLWPIAQTALLYWGLTVVSSGELQPFEAVGLTLSIGMTTGIVGITVAHELVHRRGRFERALAEFLMAQVSYTHFCIEHVYGHHANVATPRDPATARAGEGFYVFYPRTVVGGVASAWRIEAARMKRKGWPTFSIHNRMLRYGAELVVLYGMVGLLFGVSGVIFLAAQGVVAFTMLEVVNYLEHYGLERREVNSGRYEPTQPHHSWNSSHRVTNWFLFNLGRHSDHHAAAGRRFHTLRHVQEAPQLPIGYAAIFVIALVPPLWRRIMDPRLDVWRARYLVQSPDLIKSAR